MQDLRSQVTATLRACGLRLNTDLGQHFLIDPEVLEDIVAVAEIGPQDHIVEIGPGIGVLTERLLRVAKEVTAIEIDERFIAIVKACGVAPGARAKLNVIRGNALAVPMPDQPYAIVANIPYHITSPLLRHVYRESAIPPRSMTLLLQREVAENICATENAGLLTILVGLFGTPHLVRTVRASAFLPPPKVESAVLHVVSHDRPLASPEIIDRVFTLAKHAFMGKRKMLRNTIGGLPDGDALLARANISGERRPQTLSVTEWIALASA